MTDFFYNFISTLAVKLGCGGIFLLLSAISLLCFIICFLLILFRYGYGPLKRAWFYSAILCLLCVQGAFSYFFNDGIVFLLLLLATQLILVTPVILLPQRKIKCKKEQIDFVRDLDFKFKNQTEEIKPINQTVINKPQGEIDFSHVLGVIAKLEYYPLTSTEKKQVKDLTEVIRQAQNGKCEKETKIKINDGLSFLLKIMAKHGV